MLPKVTRKAKAARHRQRMILERRTVMAETSPDDSPANLGETRPYSKCTVRLTDSALRYAERHQLISETEKLELGPECQAGDLVSLETGDRPHDFVLIARR